MANPLSYFSFQPVLHDWCNKGCGMCYPVCGIMHIKEPLLIIGKSSPCGGSGFPLSLYEWSFTICLTPYNRKQNVLSASLNKTVPPFLRPISIVEGDYIKEFCGELIAAHRAVFNELLLITWLLLILLMTRRNFVV